MHYKDKMHFAPTIPFLIIQSNFGEELQVEAGLPSFRVSLKTQATYTFLRKDTNRASTCINWNTAPRTVSNIHEDFNLAMFLPLLLGLEVCCLQTKPGRPLLLHSVRYKDINQLLLLARKLILQYLSQKYSNFKIHKETKIHRFTLAAWATPISSM